MRDTRHITRRQFVGIAAVTATMFAGCTSSQDEAPAGEAGTNEASEDSAASSDEAPKTAVVYFSQTGNTAAVAAYIAEHLQASSFELKAAEPYTDADLDHNNPSSRTTVEQDAPETRPELADIPDLSAYDTVFLGYPIWHGKAPRLMCTFVEGSDLSGKTVVPFCTSGSSDIGSSPDELAALASPDATWLTGMRFAPGTDAETVAQWVDAL